VLTAKVETIGLIQPDSARFVHRYSISSAFVCGVRRKSEGQGLYYTFGQLQKMQSLMKLKELGYSLEEVRDLWNDNSHVPSPDSLEEKIRVCESELKRLSKHNLDVMRQTVFGTV